MSAKNKTTAEPKTEDVKSEVSEEVATPSVEVPKTKSEARENVTYVGPTIIGVVKSGVVFENGILPAKAQECVSKVPMMKKLFVPQSKIVEATKELCEEQSALCSIYRAVKEKFKGGN